VEGYTVTPLDYLCHLDTVADILRAVEPSQLSVMALRWQGMTNMEIAAALGVSHQAVACRLERARERIAGRVPGCAALLEGRKVNGRPVGVIETKKRNRKEAA